MSRNQKPKPTVAELFQHMQQANNRTADSILLPVALSEEERESFSENSENFDFLKGLEADYIIYASAGLIHGEETKGLYSTASELTSRQLVEEIKKYLQTRYRTHDMADDEESLARRFRELDKWVYVFASDVYPDVPKRKPDVTRIRSLLEKALEKNQIQFTQTACVNATPALGQILIRNELSYIEAVAVGLIHGTHTLHLFGIGPAAGLSTSEYTKLCKNKLEELYAQPELGAMMGAATCAEQFRALDKTAENFARSIYPDLPKQKG